MAKREHKIKKCEIDGNIITKVCDGLNLLIRGSGDAIGLNTTRLVNIDSGETTKYFISYNTERGKKGDKYIVNHCPSCGVNIKPAIWK